MRISDWSSDVCSSDLGGLGLDAADAPAEHREAVHHGGVAVGADQGVRIGQRLAVLVLGPDHLREVFQVHLVADAGARRHHAEVVECRLAPAQERVDWKSDGYGKRLAVHLIHGGRRYITKKIKIKTK